MVWVRGEHSIATRTQLSATIDQAVRLDDVDIVVDLSDVTFMDASTIGALINARNRRRASAHTLSLRAPSPLARRLLDLCGLAFLIDEHLAPTQPPVPTALGTWVDVPPADRAASSALVPVEDEGPSREPGHATAQPPVEPAGSVERRRTPP